MVRTVGKRLAKRSRSHCSRKMKPFAREVPSSRLCSPQLSPRFALGTVTPVTTKETFAALSAPLAGFYVIEAADLNEVVRLVAGTPCARTKGAIEIRPILSVTDHNKPQDA